MKPGLVPGPVTVKPDKKSDLVDFRRAKRLQDFLNSEFQRTGCAHTHVVRVPAVDSDGLIIIGESRARCAACGADVTDGVNV